MNKTWAISKCRCDSCMAGIGASKLSQQRLESRLAAQGIPIRIVLHPLALSESILDRLVQMIHRLCGGTCQSVDASDIIEDSCVFCINRRGSPCSFHGLLILAQSHQGRRASATSP